MPDRDPACTMSPAFAVKKEISVSKSGEEIPGENVG
jgi:hypothetical protein